jgi:hypothetical protein
MSRATNSYYSTTSSRRAAQQVIADISDEIPDYSTYTSPYPTPRLKPLDLVPLKRNPRKVQRVSSWVLLSSMEQPYHPSKWGPIYLQYIDNFTPLLLVGPPNAEPFVYCEPIANQLRAEAKVISHWQRFGGRAPRVDWLTYTEWVLYQLKKQSPRACSWGDTLEPGKCLLWNVAPVDLIKEHHLLGVHTVTLRVDQLNYLLPRYRHLEPVTLDLVLCQVWFDMGREYRNQHLSQHSKYLYRIYTKLPKTYGRYHLTYHADAPCYHT